MKILSYQDLDVWKNGIEIVKLVYRVTKDFPKAEMFGLTSQMRRAAVSIPTNIAEGNTRHHTKEYVQFLYVSLGSCAELETENLIARSENYLGVEDFEILKEKLQTEGKMLSGLIRSLSA